MEDKFGFVGEKVKLGDVAPCEQSKDVGEEECCWLLNLDMVEGTTGKIIEYVVVPVEDIGSSTIKFDTQNVLYSKLRPYLNKVVCPDRNGYATSEMLPLRPDTTKITREYLTWFLRSPKFVGYINEKTSGAKMPRANITDLKNYEMVLPTLEKQRNIVEQFANITKIIDKRQEELLQLDTLIKARFVEMFGDNIATIKLSDFCKFQQGTQVPVEEQKEELTEGYSRFLRIIDYTQPPQIPRYVRSTGKEIDEKSVVIVRYGATAGFVGRGYKGVLANNLFEVIPQEEIETREFLYLALKYGTFEQEIQDKAFGAAMPAISFGMMNEISVVAPNKNKQEEFVLFTSQIDKLKLEVQKSLDEFQLLFDSLMQKYFG